MKFNKLFLNFAVALSALLFGLGWVSVYQFLLKRAKTHPPVVGSVKQDFPVETIRSVPIYPDDLMKGESNTDLPNDVSNAEPEYTTEQKFHLNLAIEGYYYAFEKGVESYEDSLMEIWLGEYNEKLEEFIPGPPKGHITIDKKEYKFNKIHYSHGQLTFLTEKNGGVTFEFAGKYQQKEIFEGEGETEVLEGKLKRFKNGKLTSTKKLTLFWGVGC